MSACFCTGACKRTGICPAMLHEVFRDLSDALNDQEWWKDTIITDNGIDFTLLGWKCPLCGRANAPTRSECPCYLQED